MVNFLAKELIVFTESSHFVLLGFLPTPVPSALRIYGIIALPSRYSAFRAHVRGDSEKSAMFMQASLQSILDFSVSVNTKSPRQRK